MQEVQAMCLTAWQVALADHMQQQQQHCTFCDGQHVAQTCTALLLLCAIRLGGWLIQHLQPLSSLCQCKLATYQTFFLWCLSRSTMDHNRIALD